ncbi:redoxin domain-containing protein [Sphingomonas jatrophae]|uniref:Peroxiredoxin n=1 Tax=Sphingomonas jatrophae TaxID=1166337 RepID=A0A1I6LH23_9SPHN|nr:redoxin domain-containing protein [Sphingomonas jatrophae]SFS02620.1 Peroxiredoxin [Sphingomonas jatrophae]
MLYRTIALLTALAPAIAAAAAQVGAPAPAFTVADSKGKPVRLADYKGKLVVLEWNNPGCPYVQKHYNSGNMQRTQAAARAAGAVWLTVNSGAPGKQGHMSGPQADAFVASAKARPAAYLLDASGAVGRAYAAKTTPHMFVINPAGRLVYDGAIDDKPTADPADIKTAKNLVMAAVNETRAGKPVSVATSRPYGCSVKYAG